MTAPAPPRPATYAEALAAAQAMQSGRAVSPDPVAALSMTADQIIAAREKAAAWVKAHIQRLWGTVNPYNDKQVQDFAAQAAKLMDSAQTAAARMAAAGQVQQLASIGVRVSPSPSVPIDIRAPGAVVKNGTLQLHRGAWTVDYAGDKAKVSAADMSTLAIFQRPAETYRYVVSQGGTDANAQSVVRISTLVDDNLMLAQRLAQLQVINTAGRDKKARVTGYRRVIHPELSRGGTCGMCIAASDRLYKVAELLPIHAHCKCTIAGVTEDYDPADDLNAVDLNQLYKQAGGTSVAHLKRTRYQIDEHGELGPVLVPKKAFKPRSAASTKRAGGTGVTDSKPEAKSDVAARHLPGLRSSLADLKRRGLSDAAPQIAYHKQQIAKFERDLAA